MSRICTILLLSALPLAAQQTLDARAFVPPRYEAEAVVDFAAMRESGLWDHLSRSMVVKLLDSLEGEMGVRISNLDRLRAFPPVRVGGADQGGEQADLVLFEGNDQVGLPPAPDGGHLRPDRIAGHDVLVADYGWGDEDPDVFVSPRPGLLAYGNRRHVTAVLERSATPGVPPAEFLSLTSGRGNQAFMVVQFTGPMLADLPEEMAGMNPSAADALQYLMLRARRADAGGADDEPVFALQGILRYQTGAEGPKAAQEWLQQTMARLAQHQQLGALKRYWKKVQSRVDGRDLVVELELGNARRAAGDLGNLLAPMMLMTARGVEAAQAVEVEEAVVEEPPPPPPPPPGKTPPGGK